jgi:hypothetical protein
MFCNLVFLSYLKILRRTLEKSKNYELLKYINFSSTLNLLFVIIVIFNIKIHKILVEKT